MDRAVVYATDPGFLIPSLVSASEAAQQVSSRADVVLALSGFSDSALNELSDVAAALDLLLITVPEVELGEGVQFNETHVPPSSLLRLQLGKFLDRRYRHIIYIDGDTRIIGDITPLIEHTVAPGKILAANGNPWLGYHPRRRFLYDYLNGLGITSAFDYFNAGVLALRRETMDERFQEALEFFLANSDACRYHDQSALNAVFHGAREVMSPRYNFISDYAPLNVYEAADPAIVHFTGASKPWLYNGPPWQGRFSAAYDALVDRFPCLQPFTAAPDADRKHSFEAAYAKRKRFYRFAFPIYWLRRRRVLEYLRETNFAV